MSTNKREAMKHHILIFAVALLLCLVVLYEVRDAADCSYTRRGIDVTYPRLAVEDMGAVQLYLYDLPGTG